MSRAPEPSNVVAQAAPVTVAMVEDEAEILDSWVKLLGTFPDFACVCTCASGEEALLKQLPPLRPQIVLMDIFLPRMSGIECTAQLKELLPNTHILILTSVDDDELVFMALQAGADGYLLKSTQPAELQSALHDLLRGGAPMTGAVARRVVRYFRQKNKPKDAVLGLSLREEEVLILLSKGYGNKEIAGAVGLERGHGGHLSEANLQETARPLANGGGHSLHAIQDQLTGGGFIAVGFRHLVCHGSNFDNWYSTGRREPKSRAAPAGKVAVETCPEWANCGALASRQKSAIVEGKRPACCHAKSQRHAPRHRPFEFRWAGVQGVSWRGCGAPLCQRGAGAPAFAGARLQLGAAPARGGRKKTAHRHHELRHPRGTH